MDPYSLPIKDCVTPFKDGNVVTPPCLNHNFCTTFMGPRVQQLAEGLLCLAQLTEFTPCTNKHMEKVGCHMHTHVSTHIILCSK